MGQKGGENHSVRTIEIVFVYHNLIKKHVLQNNLTKRHGLQKSLGGEHIAPGPWTINQAGKMINKQNQAR